MVDTIERPGELAPAVTRVLTLIQELETEIVELAEPEWVAACGPRLRRIEDANILFYRAINSVRPFTKMSRRDDFDYDGAARAFLDLAAASLKIAIDCEASRVRQHQIFRKLMFDESPTVPIPAGIGGEEDD